MSSRQKVAIRISGPTRHSQSGRNGKTAGDAAFICRYFVASFSEVKAFLVEHFCLRVSPSSASALRSRQKAHVFRSTAQKSRSAAETTFFDQRKEKGKRKNGLKDAAAQLDTWPNSVRSLSSDRHNGFISDSLRGVLLRSDRVGRSPLPPRPPCSLAPSFGPPVIGELCNAIDDDDGGGGSLP